MERHVNMGEISDGRRYKSNDMVKLGCNECEGCVFLNEEGRCGIHVFQCPGIGNRTVWVV